MDQVKAIKSFWGKLILNYSSQFDWEGELGIALLDEYIRQAAYFEPETLEEVTNLIIYKERPHWYPKPVEFGEKCRAFEKEREIRSIKPPEDSSNKERSKPPAEWYDVIKKLKMKIATL